MCNVDEQLEAIRYKSLVAGGYKDSVPQVVKNKILSILVEYSSIEDVRREISLVLDEFISNPSEVNYRIITEGGGLKIVPTDDNSRNFLMNLGLLG